MPSGANTRNPSGYGPLGRMPLSLRARRTSGTPSPWLLGLAPAARYRGRHSFSTSSGIKKVRSPAAIGNGPMDLLS